MQRRDCADSVIVYGMTELADTTVFSADETDYDRHNRYSRRTVFPTIRPDETIDPARSPVCIRHAK